jgi:hypothetical protein
LLCAYRATDFVVFRPRLTIRIGRRCPRLDRLLASQHVGSWAFVTAWNPGSRPLSRKANDMRHRRLLRVLDDWKRQLPDGRRAWLPGVGRPHDETWSPEVSVLVLGMSVADARKFGRRFGQVAVITGSRERAARLTTC